MAEKTEWKRFTILIAPELLKELKQKALDTGTTASEIALNGIKKELEK